MADPALERLRLGNPAARSLPLLERVASQASGEIILPYLTGSQVAVDFEP